MARIVKVSFGNQYLQIFTHPDCDLTINHHDELSYTFTYNKNTYTLIFQNGIIKLQNKSGNFSWIQNSVYTSMIFEDAPKPDDFPAFSTDHFLKSIGNNSTIISTDVFMKLLASQSSGSIAIGAGSSAVGSRSFACGAGSSAVGPGSCAIGNNTFFQ